MTADVKRIEAGRRALGKGLDSLLPRIAAPTAPAAEAETGKPLEIALGDIDRNPYQTRMHFDEKAIAELAASIATNGVVQPILVRPLPNGRFQLIAGERRWLASEKAGKSTIPAVLRQVSDEQAMEITIVENLQRADLNPIEEARAYERLSREFGMTQEQMAIRVGKDRATIGNFIRLLRLPDSIQESLSAGGLSFGHGKVLLALESQKDMEKAAKQMILLAMNVRQAERYVHGLIYPERPEKKAGKKAEKIDPNVREAQERLQRALGLRVRIEDRKGKGRVIIEYGRLEDFDGLMEIMTGNRE